MITSITEFFFSKHYMYDGDNRFKTRIKNAEILNQFDNQEEAEYRFKRAMYHYGITILDKANIAKTPIALTFGNLYFRQNKKLIKTEINIDGRTGNLYTVVIKGGEIVTLLLHPFEYSNGDILNKLKEHDGGEFKGIYDITLKELNPDDRKRKTTIIDLDISHEDFIKEFPAPITKTNNIDSVFSPTEKLKFEEEENKNKPEEIEFSINAIPMEFKKLVPNKEFVIYRDMKILVNVNGEIKEKTIRDLIIDETGDSRKYELEFENTLKKLPLEIGDRFIISPKLDNKVYNDLIIAFNLKPGQKLNFEGRITKFNFYKKGKGGSDRPKLGVIINPTKYF